MIDDSELRARIAARVAARRAESSIPESSESPAPARPRLRRPRPGPRRVAHPAPDPVEQDAQPVAAQKKDATKDTAQDTVQDTAKDARNEAATSEPGAAQQEPETPKRQRNPAVRRTVRIAVLLGIAAVAALMLRLFVVAPYYIPSGSMEPTLHGCAHCNDDHILIDKISYHFHSPQEGDIVVFNRPPRAQTSDPVLVKRVIGLPGDHLALRRGRVFIDGKRLVEPYLDKKCGPRPTQPTSGRSRWTIPKGDVFVMGDNRCNSLDSRDFGPIPESLIIGRAFAIVWPLNRITLF